MAVVGQRKLSSGGGALSLDCPVYRPEKQQEVTRILLRHPGSVIMRGGGTSYGDSALETGGVISSERLNRFLHFDIDKGRIRVEGGVSVADVVAATVPRGWWLPALPGNARATIGGCIATNAFHSNQSSSGEMAVYVRELSLQLPSGRVIRCSPMLDPDMFYATLGGLGLTGYIKEVSLQLMRLPSPMVEVARHRCENAEELVRALRGSSVEAEFVSGWLDQSAPVESLGRGIVSQAGFCEATEVGASEAVDASDVCRQGRDVSFLRGLTRGVRMQRRRDKRRFVRAGASDAPERKPLLDWLFPVSYNKRPSIRLLGFIPDSAETHLHLHRALHLLLEKGAYGHNMQLNWHRARPLLANDNGDMGRLDWTHPSMLRFCGDGLSLRFELPFTPQSRLLIKDMTRHLAHVGGRVHMAEDAVASLEELQRMYGERLERWWEAVSIANGKGVFASHMGLRLSASHGGGGGV